MHHPYPEYWTSPRIARIYLILVFSLSTIPVSAGTFEEGVSAYQRGRYTEALELWRPHAEAGNPLAQVLLGSLYAFGLGVNRDDREAVRWFTLAARQGSAQGQYNLAVMYEHGWGVEQDRARALYWYEQAADQGRHDARDKLAALQRNPGRIPDLDQEENFTEEPTGSEPPANDSDGGQPDTGEPADIVASRDPGSSLMQGHTVSNAPSQPVPDVVSAPVYQQQAEPVEKEGVPSLSAATPIVQQEQETAGVEDDSYAKTISRETGERPEPEPERMGPLDFLAGFIRDLMSFPAALLNSQQVPAAGNPATLESGDPETVTIPIPATTTATATPGQSEYSEAPSIVHTPEGRVSLTIYPRTGKQGQEPPQP